MRHILTIGISFLVSMLAIATYYYFINNHPTNIDNAQFVQKTLLKHEEKMSHIADNLLNNHNDHTLHTHKTDDYSLYLFTNGTLTDWHNATIPNTQNLITTDAPIIETANGWYYLIRKDSTILYNNDSITHLTAIITLKIKNNYAYENEYLQPSFHSSFNASKNSLISLTPYNNKSIAIKNTLGKEVFHFVPANNDNEHNNYLAIIALCIWFIAILVTIILTVRYVKLMWLKFFLAIGLLSLLYLWTTYLNYPQPLQSWGIFSSTVFAVDWWLPSLGHLTILCGLITILVILIFKHIKTDNPILRWSLPLIIFLSFIYIINIIVFHSTDIILYADNIDIQTTTIVKITCITLLILSILFAIQWARKTDKFITFQNFVWQIFAMSLFSLLLMTVLNKKKEFTSRSLLQSNIAFQLTREDDPVAETLLISFEDNIINDTIIAQMIDNNDKLYEYLRNTYFNGYFSRYDLQVIPCLGNNALLTITTYSDQHNCYDYFSNMVNEYGNQIGEKSKFYYLTDNDGRASYLGIFDYNSARLFIEINAKRNNDQIGYPELLTNSRDRMNNQLLEDYSYSLYYDGILSAQHGQLKYPQHNNWIDSTKTFQLFNNYSHLISHPTKNHTIVISYPKLSLNNFIADYSFLVLSMFLISLFILYLIKVYNIKLFNISTIHDRIQYSFVLFILALLLILCIAQGYQSVERYEDISHKRLTQNITSISKVIQHDIASIKTNEELDNLLWRTANTFMIDINIYSTKGELIATSRRELFSSGIAPTLINPKALSELQNPLSLNEIFIEENIGLLQYFSSYMPITNEQNQIVAYLNVPYFSDIKAKKETLLTSFVPITNIYMILILIAIGFSSLMARSITKPLLIISNNIKNIALGKNNKKINYPHNDEIGILVNEYNRMLDELAYSAEKLAASERENTWREMARQIAHEIKNPLTPMKLSVQYLVKAWDNRRDDFDKFIRKVSNTLIEQIDQLSFIASEFSSLAKTPHGEKSRINIYERLQNTVNLWSKTENLTISLITDSEHIYILANGDQMTSIFNNLIKNALQAMPTERTAQIDIRVTTNADNVQITVTDNGNGIPAEIHEKIFKPNFTTKSTGMGLGLAIVNNIVLEHNGEISFTTKENEYTTFKIILPKLTE